MKFKRSITWLVALLTGGFPIAHAAGSPTVVSTPNLQYTASVPYRGGSDIEFQTRFEPEVVTVITYKIVRTKVVSCRTRGVRCRRGQKTKTIRIRPRRVAVRTQITRIVKRNYAFTGSSASFTGGDPAGLRIFDVTDPSQPKLRSFFVCHTNQNDIQILERNGRTYVLLGLDSAAPSNHIVESDCFNQLGLSKASTGLLVVDVTDVGAPRAVGFLPLLFGVHNSTIHPGGRYVYVSDAELLRNGFRENDLTYSPAKIQVVDIEDPSHPVFLREIDLPPGMSAHDITFNSDGTRAYAASLSQTVILDSSAPSFPRLVSVIEDPAINIHHQADPYTVNGKTYLIITDEITGAAGNFSCPGGGLHIYDITNELTPAKLGVFFVPDLSVFAQDGRFRCTAHVMRIYPDRNILTIAWYNAGIWVLDIANPLEFKAIGMAYPTLIDGRPTDAWAAKLYEDHIFTNDLNRGMDIFRYTGPASPIQVAATTSAMNGQSSRSQNVSFDTQGNWQPFCFDNLGTAPLS